MPERKVLLSQLSPEQYDRETVARTAPMTLEIGDECTLRVDMDAFDEYAGVAGQPAVGYLRVRVKSKIQDESRWSMLVLNRLEETDQQDPPTDFYVTFDDQFLLQRFDTYPVRGDIMRSLEYARESYSRVDIPGGYILPVEGAGLTDGEIGRTVDSFDAEVAELLGSQ